MAAINVSVLVAARNEYSDQLKRYLSPLLLEGFISIYEDAVTKESREQGYKFKRQFQIFLREIPRWNASILEEETRRIQERVPFFHKLITAIFVAHVKILGSVRLGGSHENVKIKVPTDDILIHSIYVNAAENIFTSIPILQAFEHHTERSSNDQIKKLIEDSIDETISSMVPVQNILEEYLSTVFNEDVEPDDEPDEPDDEDLIDFSEELDSKDMGLDDLDEGPSYNEVTRNPNGLDDRVDYSDLEDVTSADPNAPKIPIFENDDLGEKSNIVTSSLKIMDLEDELDDGTNENKFGLSTKNWDDELFGTSNDNSKSDNDFSFTESAPVEDLDFSFLKKGKEGSDFLEMSDEYKAEKAEKDKNDSSNDFSFDSNFGSTEPEKPVEDFSFDSNFGSSNDTSNDFDFSSSNKETEDFNFGTTEPEKPSEDFSFKEELINDMNSSNDFGSSNDLGSNDFGSSNDLASTNVVDPSDIFGSSGPNLDLDDGEDLFKTGNQGISEDPVGFF